MGSSWFNNDVNVLRQSPVLNDLKVGKAPEVHSLANKRSNDVKRIRYKQAHEAARKDVERAFGVLKKKWAIVRTPARSRSLKRITHLMYTCIILHNMIRKEKGKAISPDFYPEEQHREDDPEYEAKVIITSVVEDEELFSKLCNEDVVRVCLLLVLDVIIMGSLLEDQVNYRLMRLVENIDARDRFPVGFTKKEIASAAAATQSYWLLKKAFLDYNRTGVPDGQPKLLLSLIRNYPMCYSTYMLVVAFYLMSNAVNMILFLVPAIGRYIETSNSRISSLLAWWTQNNAGAIAAIWAPFIMEHMQQRELEANASEEAREREWQQKLDSL
ncbi:ALP1-like protein [Tanacetum coccineum]|uniref:ALP1-like protein n=1 Tax=Tanacetum coccineum TaxID=301880 RepID=A0ABQ4ZX30_9ASTR